MTRALLLVLLASAGQDPVPDDPRAIAIPPLPIYSPDEPKSFELECGARLFVVESRLLPTIDGVLRFRAGTAIESPGQVGLATLVADALRSGGSKELPGGRLDAWLDARAATLEVQAGLDSIDIRFSCLVGDLAPLIRQIAHLLVAPAYPEAAVDAARTRLLASLRPSRRSDARIADEALAAACHGASSPLARVPTPEILRTVGRKDLLAFHRANLGPGRLVAGVSGSVDGDALAKLFEGSFAALPTVGPPPEIPTSPFIAPTETRILLVDRPEATATELRLASKGTRYADPDQTALHLWSSAVSAPGAASQLARIADDAGGGFRAGWNRPGRFVARCRTSNESAAEVLGSMLDVLRRGLQPLREEELESARRRCHYAELLAADSPGEVVERAVELALHGYPESFWRERAARLRKLTADEVAEAAGRRIDPNRLVVVAVGPAAILSDALAVLGPVERLETAAPAAVHGNQPAAVETLLDAVGGRERWASLAALEAEIDVVTAGREIPTRQWRDLAGPRFRADAVMMGETVTTVLDGDVAWMRTRQGLVELPVGDLLRQKQRGLWDLLHALATGVGIEARVEDGALRVTNEEGLDVVLTVDESGRPSTVTFHDATAAKVHAYSNWRDVGGYLYPGVIEEAPTRNRWIVESFRPLEVFDPELVAR